MPLLSCVTPASYLTSLSISFLICKMATVRERTSRIWKVKSARTSKARHRVGTQTSPRKEVAVDAVIDIISQLGV